MAYEMSAGGGSRSAKIGTLANKSEIVHHLNKAVGFCNNGLSVLCSVPNAVVELSKSFVGAEDSAVVKVYDTFINDISKCTSDLLNTIPHTNSGIYGTIMSSTIGTDQNIPALSEVESPKLDFESAYTGTETGSYPEDVVLEKVQNIYKLSKNVQQEFTSAIAEYQAIWGISDNFGTIQDQAHECAKAFRGVGNNLSKSIDAFSSGFLTYLEDYMARVGTQSGISANAIMRLKASLHSTEISIGHLPTMDQDATTFHFDNTSE